MSRVVVFYLQLPIRIRLWLCRLRRYPVRCPLALNFHVGNCRSNENTHLAPNFPPAAGYYGNGSYLDSQRMTSLVDQHVSVISSVGSLRHFPSTFSEVHDPLNILDEPGRKTTGGFFSEVETGAGQLVEPGTLG